MKADQYEGLIAALAEIRDRLPEPVKAEEMRPGIEHPATDSGIAARERGSLVDAGAALTAMARVARGWAEEGYENDVAQERRDIRLAPEQPFVLADILNMIDDAASSMGLAPRFGPYSDLRQS